MQKRKIVFISMLIVFIFLISLNSYALKSPDRFFNKKIGADKTLIIYPKIIEYFQYLSKNSTMIKLSKEGYSTLNNPMYVVFISSENNIKNLDKYISINKKLANPDLITAEEAKKLIKEGKVFVLITATIHSTEIASSQMSMLFAYNLITSHNPEIKKILDNVVILFMPSINPDGNIMVTNWYYKYLNTPYEGGRLPFLYHYYAGHDDNRDFVALNLKETKVVNSVLHHKYFPQIFLDMHQMGRTGPRMFVPPFKDPLNKNLSPIMLNSTAMIGSYMGFKLTSAGKKGVASAYSFDAYWIGGSKNTAWYKNVIGLLTELASAKIASPVYIDHNELSAGRKGLPEYKAQVNFPAPWQGGWWRLKDIIDYEMIADKALIEVASKNRVSFLENFYKMGKNQIKKGENEPPFAYIIDSNQWDMPETYTFLKKIIEHGIRLYRLKKDVILHNKIYKKGSYLIPMNQPYRAFIKAIMEKQVYPKIKYIRSSDKIIEPYDATGWTMPIMMGINYYEINKLYNWGKDSERVFEIDYPITKISNQKGKYYILSTNSNRTFIIINHLLENGYKVYRAMEQTKDTNLGDFLLKTNDISRDKLLQYTKNTGISYIKTVSPNNIKLKILKEPKLAIYQSYRASIDEGWTRWVLDNYGFHYKILHNSDFKNKNIVKNVKTIIIPDIPRETVIKGKDFMNWYLPMSLPPEYRGGIGKTGIERIKRIVKNGGSLILLDSSYEIAQKDFKLPLRNILKNISRDKFNCPGSILRLYLDNKDPLAWGMPKKSIIYFSNSPVFKTSLPSTGDMDRKIIGRFSDAPPHLISGYLKGEDFLNRKVSIIRFKYFKGEVIVIGGRIQNRAQTYSTFKILFNAILNSGTF